MELHGMPVPAKDFDPQIWPPLGPGVPQAYLESIVT